MADGVIRNILERSIDELPDELRIVFVACVVDGMTPEQFAELFAPHIGDGRGMPAQRPKFAA
jgi:RNA polymerase sigma-70 factor (ECF subfamily)